MSTKSLKPLRKVIAESRERDGDWEYLECGHRIIRKHDMIGPTNAARRRCHRCASGKPQDFDPETIQPE